MKKPIKNVIQSLESLDVTLKINFGEWVRFLREKKGLTRQQLSVLCMLPYKTIVDIEYGEKANLDRKTITLLSNGIDLQGLARRNFFIIAGLAPEIEPTSPIGSTELQNFYKAMKYPALVVDSLMNIHSLNSYMTVLLDIDLAKLGGRLFDSAGPNILRYIFDPLFDARRLLDSEWKAYAQLQIVIFRYLSQYQINRQPYQTLLNTLKQLPDFVDIWGLTDNTYIPMLPYFATIFNNKYGKVKYLHCETILVGFYAEQIKVAFYMPFSPEDEAGFEKIRENTANMAFEFMRDQKEVSRIL